MPCNDIPVEAPDRAVAAHHRPGTGTAVPPREFRPTPNITWTTLTILCLNARTTEARSR